MVQAKGVYSGELGDSKIESIKKVDPSDFVA